MRQKVMEVNERLGYKLDPDAQVGSLKLADQQLTEIARAVLSEPKLLIMDEPTAALSEEEVERLFAILLKLRDQGVGIIYISHRLEEVVHLADRVTVFKDGKNAGELERGDISKDRMITMMVGRTLSDIYPDRSAVTPGEVLLDVKGLRVPRGCGRYQFYRPCGRDRGPGRPGRPRPAGNRTGHLWRPALHRWGDHCPRSEHSPQADHWRTHPQRAGLCDPRPAR